MAELVFRPDAHPETTSVDGIVWEFFALLGTGKDWADIHDGEGNEHSDDDTYDLFPDIASDNVLDKWRGIGRVIIVFDTSSLPNGARIISATLSLYGAFKVNQFLGWSPTYNIYSAAPASNDDLVDGDYNSLGALPYCDTPIAYGDWDDSGWNDFVLNEIGLTAISTIGATYIGVRESTFDAANIEPPVWQSASTCYILFRAADFGDGSLAPKLTVTYSSGQGSVDQTIVGNKVSLEAIRNLEIVYGGRAYIDKSGYFVYESRYHRNT